MAITTDDFNKIWASTSPLTPYSFSESQYKEGWNFIGGTPPSRQMWDFLQKNNDEKMQYLLNNFDNYLPLSGGTLTGAINTANKTWNKLGDDASFGDHDIGGKMCVKSQTFRNTGIAFFDQSDKNVGVVDVNNAFDFDHPVKENGGLLVPIGVVQAYAGSTIPTGWLLCDGSAVSRTDYAALYAVIGTTYGAGNGSTTFNLPNLIDKFVEGSATAGTVKSAGLPNITGDFKSVYSWADMIGSSGALVHTIYSSNSDLSGATSKIVRYEVTFDASRSNSVYGNSTTVQPPALTMRYIIKY